MESPNASNSPARNGGSNFTRSLNKDADFFDVDSIQDSIPKHEFKDFNHHANASSVAPKLSTELDASQKPKIPIIPRYKPNKPVSKDNKSEKHSKNNDVFNKITKIFQRKPTKKRPRSQSNHNQYSDSAISMKYRYMNDSDNETESAKEHSYKGKSYLIPPTEKKKEKTHLNAHSDSSENTKHPMPTPKKLTHVDDVEDEDEEELNESQNNDKIISLSKYLRKIGEKSHQNKTYRYVVNPISIDDLFVVGSDQLTSIFESSKHNFDMREINTAKSQLNSKTKKATESLHRTTEKVDGLQTKFLEIQNQIHQTYQHIDSTQQKADVIKARVRNLVDKMEIAKDSTDSSKNENKFNEDLLESAVVDDYFPREINGQQQIEKEKPPQNIVSSVFFGIYSFILFILSSIGSYFVNIKKDFESASKKKKRNSKGKKKANKHKNKMIKIVKTAKEEQ